MCRLRVKAKELARLSVAAGIADTHNALAEFIGVNHGTISRLMADKSAPGPVFIARACGAFGARLDDLFEVVDS